MKEVNKHPHYVVETSLSIFGGNFVLARVCRGGGGGGWCPLFGVERCPLLGGSKCISGMVKSTGASEASTVQRLSAFCREVLLYFLMEAA